MYAYCVMISYNTTILYIIIDKYSSRTFLHCLLVSLLPTSSQVVDALHLLPSPTHREPAFTPSWILLAFLPS